MADRPLATIVILSRERREELRRTLTEMREQVCTVEIIVVDNGSRDGTAAMVRRDFPAITLIENPDNRGTAGRNQGIAAAAADIIITLDDDSIIGPGIIPEVLDYFSRYPEVAAVGFKVVDAQGREEPWFVWPYCGDDERGYASPSLMTCGAALRRDAVLQVGGFFAPYLVYVEERDLCTRLLGAGYHVRYCPRWTAVHRRAPGQRSPARFIYYVTRNTYWYIVRNFSWDVALGKLVRWKFCSFIMAARSRALLAWLRGSVAVWFGLGAVLKSRKPVPRHCLDAVDGRFSGYGWWR